MQEAPAGYVVTVAGGDRVFFADWGGPAVAPRAGIALIHGLSQTSWIWAPAARSLATSHRTVAMDLRGHGLSDAPTEDGAYDLAVLAEDVEAVADGAGLLDAADARVLLVGHGFGAIIAAAAATRLGERCAGVVLVDGGWGSVEAATGVDVDESLRTLEEPPEVMASMAAFLADRAAFDPATWDDDQEAAARATVVETHAGRVVPATRPHALEACVRTMYAADPDRTIAGLDVPVLAIVGDAPDGPRSRALAVVSAARVAAGRPPVAALALGPIGHNVMRYRPAEVTEAIRSAAR